MKKILAFPLFFALCMSLFAQVSITDFSPRIEIALKPVTLTGSGFGTTAAENRVFFGSMEAVILNASATSLTIEVPLGAQPGKITVLNTTSSLQGQTMFDFYPTFEGGARIIPATFRPHQDLGLLEAVTTVRMMDVDGDGWLDIISISRNHVQIFRNRGAGGILDVTSFDARIDITPGSGSFNDIGFADLDNDGNMDIYFSSDDNPAGRIGIYRNTSTPGSISFDPLFSLNAASMRISYVGAADVDGDGRQELFCARGASCGPFTSYFLVFPNLSDPGALSFGPVVNLTNTNGACTYERMVFMDINNDNKLDIAVQRSFKARVSFLLNQSTQGLVEPASFDTDQEIITGSSTIAMADFDGDDLPELITHNAGNNSGTAIHRNASSGSVIAFSDSIPFYSNIFREGEAKIADLNGDSEPDILIAADWSQNWFSVMENNVNGALDQSSFHEPVRFETNEIYPVTLDVGDLNKDGRQDVVTSNGSTFLSVFENASAFPPVITSVSRYQATVGEVITLNGLNFGATASDNFARIGSAEAQVLTASPTQLTIEVPNGSFYDYLSVSTGLFSAKSPRKFTTRFGTGADFDAGSFAAPVIITAAADVPDLDLGDMDNDGWVDIIAREGSNMRILRNQAIPDVIDNSTFSDVSTSLLMPVSQANLEDINGDGYLDIVNGGRIYRNITETGTEPIEFANFVTSGTANPRNFVLADLNADGLSDIIESTTTIDIRIKENRIGWGDQFYQTNAVSESIKTHINLPKAAVSGNVAVADLDGDGWPDIAGTNPSLDNVSIFRNLGIPELIDPSSFDAPVEFAVGDNPNTIEAGDLDLDGKIDLVIGNVTEQSVTVLHNQSTPGNFSFDTYTYPISAQPQIMRLHDLDGDAKPEIVIMTVGPAFSVLKNRTASIDASSFADENVYSLPANNGTSWDFEIADLDNDERPDLVFSSINPDEIRVVKNLVSAAAVISVDIQPVDALACDGDMASFDVEASGTTNITYQWQQDDGSGFVDLFDGTGVIGANTPNLQVSAVLPKDGYTYQCMISGDLAPDEVSDIATLFVSPFPNDPQGMDASACTPGTLTLMASGAADGEYRWYDVQTGGNMFPGEFNSSFTTPSLSITTNYFVSINDGLCESNRIQVTAFILQPVSITAHPIDQNVSVDGMVTLSVTATGDNLQFQWQKDGADINGANTDTYTIPSAQTTDSGLYACLVSNDCSSELSIEALVTVGSGNLVFSVIDNQQQQTLVNGQATPIDFGSTGIQTPVSRDFEIRNTSTTPLMINDITTTNAAFAATNIPGIIDAAGSGFITLDFEENTPGIYTANVRINTDAGLFTFPVEGEITDSPGSDLIIYNALAPDGDGKNDYFKIENIENFSGNRVKIFNRWGELVSEIGEYDNSNPSSRFEGRTNVSGNKELLEGSYFYIIEYDGKRVSGHLFLRR